MWDGFLSGDAPGYDVLICPVFATAAYPHDHSGTDFNPFWRETGRRLSVDGTDTLYQSHVSVVWLLRTGPSRPAPQ